MSPEKEQVWFKFVESAAGVNTDEALPVAMEIDDSNVYLALTTAITHDFNGTPLVSTNNNNIAATRLSLVNGTQSWIAISGGPNRSEFCRLVLSTTSLFILSDLNVTDGYTEFDTTLVPATPAGMDGLCMSVAKLNTEDGVQQWFSLAGTTTGNDVALQILSDSQDNPIILCSLNSGDLTAFNGDITTISNEETAMISKLDANTGDQIWLKHVNSGGINEFGRFAIQTTTPSLMALNHEDNIHVHISIATASPLDFNGAPLTELADFLGVACVVC